MIFYDLMEAFVFLVSLPLRLYRNVLGWLAYALDGRATWAEDQAAPEATVIATEASLFDALFV